MKTRKEIVPCICGSLDHKNHPNESTHTPTPWKVAYVWQSETVGAKIWKCKIETGQELYCPANSIGATKEIAEANAAYIVRAVNSHEQMLAMLKHLVSLDYDDTDNLESLKESAHELIAKAEGK
jgi:hypothetical protein